MKDLYLQLRKRKSKKVTSNGKRNTSMVNMSEKQTSEERRHGNGLGKVIWKKKQGLISVAPEQALRMNWIRKNIDGQAVSEKCRISGERDESIIHLIAECKKLRPTSTNSDILILQELYTWNYARSLAWLTGLIGITTNLQR